MEIQVIQHGMDSIISITSHFPIIISKCKLWMCCEYAQHLRPIEYLPKIFAVRPSLFCCNFKYLFITAYAYKTAMVWQSNCVLHICGEGGGGGFRWRIEQRNSDLWFFLRSSFVVIMFWIVMYSLSLSHLLCRIDAWCDAAAFVDVFHLRKTHVPFLLCRIIKKSSRRTVHKQLLHT